MTEPRRALEVQATQVKHPWRTTLRTVVWWLLALLAALSVGLPVIADDLGGYLPAELARALVWLAGLATVVLALLQRLVLLEPVARLLTRIGLGTGEARAIDES